jgi:ATP-dependent Clp protease protease subunit
MQYLQSPVNTICMGLAASMACFLLAAGTRGKRSALPHARIMQHQPSQTGGGGTASDIEIQAREVVHLRTEVNRLMGKHTGQPVERIERDFDRDYYMSAEQARAYGIIDRVVTRGALVEESERRAVTA